LSEYKLTVIFIISNLTH